MRLKFKIFNLVLISLTLIMCMKENSYSNKSSYLNYNKFKENYSYISYENDYFYLRVLLPTSKTSSMIENSILTLYL